LALNPLVGKDVRDDEAYITWQFRCWWDIEHGFQVITHADRVIEIAPETDIWNIYKDNGTHEQALKEYNDRMSVSRPVSKKSGGNVGREKAYTHNM
jgi:hypothetical protein